VIDLFPFDRNLLRTWFDDECNQPICGAYYVYVEQT